MRVAGSAPLTTQMAYSRFIGLILAVCWTASAGANDAYKVDPGPFEIVAVEIELPFPELDKQLPLRIAYPGAPGLYPVIVFSHGGGCPKDMYLRLSDHWASHGYVVISPVHADSRSLLTSFAGLDPKDVGAADLQPPLRHAACAQFAGYDRGASARTVRPARPRPPGCRGALDGWCDGNGGNRPGIRRQLGPIRGPLRRRSIRCAAADR